MTIGHRITMYGAASGLPTLAQLQAFYTGLLGMGLVARGAPSVDANGARALFTTGGVMGFFVGSYFYIELIILDAIDRNAVEALFASTFTTVTNRTVLEDIMRV